MNLIDGTCWLPDFLAPSEKIRKLDHWTTFLADRKRLEERLQNMATELTEQGWTVLPPRA